MTFFFARGKSGTENLYDCDHQSRKETSMVFLLPRTHHVWRNSLNHVIHMGTAKYLYHRATRPLMSFVHAGQEYQPSHVWTRDELLAVTPDIIGWYIKMKVYGSKDAQTDVQTPLYYWSSTIKKIIKPCKKWRLYGWAALHKLGGHFDLRNASRYGNPRCPNWWTCYLAGSLSRAFWSTEYKQVWKS